MNAKSIRSPPKTAECSIQESEDVQEEEEDSWVLGRGLLVSAIVPDLNVYIFWSFCFSGKSKMGKFNLVKHTSHIPSEEKQKTPSTFWQNLLVLPQPPCYARHLSFVLVDLYLEELGSV